MRRTSWRGALRMRGSPLLDVPGSGGRVSYLGFQETFGLDVTVEDVHRYPSVSKWAYTADEAKWCEATYNLLEGLLYDTQRARRNLPPKKRVRLHLLQRLLQRRQQPVQPLPPGTLRTMTTNLSSHPVPGREDTKPGRQFYVHNMLF